MSCRCKANEYPPIEMGEIFRTIDNLEKPAFEEFPRHPFLTACFEGDAELVEYYIKEMKVDIKERYGTIGSSPLYEAVSNYFDDESGHNRVIQMLLEHGANPYVTNLAGVSVAEIIIRHHENLIDVILDHLPDINKPINKLGSTPLHVAVRYCTEEAVRKLLVRNAYVNIVTRYKMQPIHEAVKYGRIELIDALIEYGADLNTPRSSNGYSPVHYAKSGDMVVKLAQCGANINVRSEWGLTPLCVAVSTAAPGKYDVVIALLNCGADYKIPNLLGYTAFESLKTKVVGSFDLEETLNMAEVFVQHVRSKIPPDQDDRETNFIREFGLELDSIKTRKMGESPVTFWRFLISNDRRAARYARHREIGPAVLAEPYKCFECPLKAKYFQGLERTNLEDVVRGVLWRMFKAKFPIVVVDLIISFLDVEHLDRIANPRRRRRR